MVDIIGATLKPYNIYLSERVASTTGVSMVPGLNGAGANVVRSALHYANPNDYGADPTGVASSVAAYNLAKATGKGVRWTAGTYLIDAAIELTGGSCFIGESISGVEFVVDTASFLKVVDGPNYSRTRVESFTVLPNDAPTTDSYGIKHEVTNFSPLRNSITVKDIVFRGADDVIISTKGFHRYLWTDNTYGGEARNVRIEGTYTPANNPSGQFAGIGAHISGQSVGFVLDHCNFNALHTYAKIDETTEGAFLINCEGVGCREGVDASGGQPGFWMTSCHMNCTSFGLKLDGRTDVNIMGNSFYRAGTFFDEEFNAIIGDDVTGAEFVGNKVTNSLVAGAAENRGIYLTNSTQVNVVGISIRDTNEGINIGDGCTYTEVIGANFNSVNYPFKTHSNVSHIVLGQHKISGTTIADYTIATMKASIQIWRGALAAQRAQSQAPAASDATELLTKNADSQVSWRNFSAGGAPYTYNIDLDLAGAFEGDIWEIHTILPSSTNPTVLIRTGSGGSTLVTMNVASSTRYYTKAAFDATGAWKVLDHHVTLV